MLPAGRVLPRVPRLLLGLVLFEPDDHLILFLVDKSKIREVERLFQAPLSFF